jgi:hypothetical protein
MNTLFNDFHQQVKRRTNKFGNFYSFGEDSIRYDFYHTAVSTFGLNPEDIILEQAIPSTQFSPKVRDLSTLKQGRHEDKPEFDLRIDPNGTLERGILAEFAFFRRTERSENQDRSGRFGKLLNEIHRLALLKNYSNENANRTYADFSSYRCLLVCVTDDEMMDYGTFIGGQKVGIIDEFRLSKEFLSSMGKTIRDKIDRKFTQKVDALTIIPTAKRVFDIEEPKTSTLPRWATWVWEVDYQLPYAAVA